MFGQFGPAYDDPEAVTARSYLADLAVSDADVSGLATHVARRMFAVPLPGPAEDGAPVDVSDPAVRRALAEDEFGTCTPHAGLTQEEFWPRCTASSPNCGTTIREETFQAARRLFASGAAQRPAPADRRQAGPAATGGQAGPAATGGQTSPAATGGQTGPAATGGQTGTN